MAKAKKWMADHDKDLKIDYIEKEEIESHKTDVLQTKEEQSKGFSLNEVYEIIKESKELKAKLAEIELKAGAVLNRTNKQDLKDAQAKIQKVLDSAETTEPTEEGKAVDELEIEDDRVFDLEELDDLEIEEKEAEEKPKKENNGIDIDEKELIEIIHSALEVHINKSVENVSKNIKQDIDDNFKRLAGKVM